MANVFSVNVYQINNQDPIPLGSTAAFAFPFAGIMVRAIPNGVQLANGIVCYSTVQTLSNGSQYTVQESETTIVAAS